MSVEPVPRVGMLRLTLGAVDGLIDSLSQTPDHVVRQALLLSINMQAIMLQEEAVRLFLAIDGPDGIAGIDERGEAEGSQEVTGGGLE